MFDQPDARLVLIGRHNPFKGRPRVAQGTQLGDNLCGRTIAALRLCGPFLQHLLQRDGGARRSCAQQRVEFVDRTAGPGRQFVNHMLGMSGLRVLLFGRLLFGDLLLGRRAVAVQFIHGRGFPRLDDGEHGPEPANRRDPVPTTYSTELYCQLNVVHKVV